jgi:DNA repair exonuclease SbcCD nuclease subunit
MFRFIHSADWQLGARFSQFGSRATVLREARLQTLARALRLGVERQADAFLIAGDLFEDNQVSDPLVGSVMELFNGSPGLPVFILPGNHDPCSGPDSVWERRNLRLPSHVRVLKEAQVVQLTSDVALLASPLTQKRSTTDPSLRLAELSAGLDPGTVRIGLTHGAPAIPGRHQPNDFPIALDAATRAGLDYLGIGHWHNWLADLDGGRIVMPGTPEPDQFDQERSGSVAWVELGRRGEPIRVERVEVAGLKWRALELDFRDPTVSRARVEAELGSLEPGSAVVRVTMKGAVSPGVLGESRAWLGECLKSCLVSQLVDSTRVELNESELADLGRRHPLLVRVLADIDRMELLLTGRGTGAGVESGGMEPMTPSEVAAVLDGLRIGASDLGADHFSRMREVLLQTVQEVVT